MIDSRLSLVLITIATCSGFTPDPTAGAAESRLVAFIQLTSPITCGVCPGCGAVFGKKGGIRRISHDRLDYGRSERVDRFGNQFKFWANVGMADGRVVTAWDVFFVHL